jgi:hypothetical protein
MKYDLNSLDNLKFKFDNYHSISENYSEASQDMFVLTMLNGKKNGSYLEIGASHPIEKSNTYLLESKFGWSGVSIDIEKNDLYESTRSNKYIVKDALDIDYLSLLKENNFPKQVDYLQLDIEPLDQTLKCLDKIPLDEYRFSVITYEHDFYTRTPDISDPIRKKSREILSSYGYKLICSNISVLSPPYEQFLPNGSKTYIKYLFPFEDWWVDPTVVDENIIKLILESNDSPKYHEDAIFRTYLT